jgi:sarcosine oxidase gamma subunit
MTRALIQGTVWNLNKSFNISRGAKTTADTLQVHLIKMVKRFEENVFPIPV